jgi:hypothetical protein
MSGWEGNVGYLCNERTRFAQLAAMVREHAVIAELVMPGLVPGIHALFARKKHVDGRDKPGHDES